MRARRRFTTTQRRARLVARHHLGRTAPAVETAVRDLVAVHSSDPATPYLALRARVSGFRVADLDRALYDDRTLWRLHAMRRTLFVVPAEHMPVVQAACGADVARAERSKLERWVAASLDDDPRAWLQEVGEKTLAVLSDGRARRTQEMAAQVSELAVRVTVGSGRWTAEVPLSSRLLSVLAMEGDLVRARPAGSWLSSQYHWADARTWFPRGVREDPGGGGGEARARLARWWLRAHGPATETDLRWWTGWTARRSREALGAAGAVEVELESGSTPGWVLPDDVDTDTEAVPAVALLPGLDPTAMGWKERGWYGGGHAAQLFDRNGNAGPTVWVDGRMVGGWAQRPDGTVVHRLLEDVGDEATARVEDEAAALTRWCDGVAPVPRFPSPLSSELAR